CWIEYMLSNISRHVMPQSFVSSVVLAFFFQAEEGIRDRNVTGVQTCALPICSRVRLFGFGLSSPGPHARSRPGSDMECSTTPYLSPALNERQGSGREPTAGGGAIRGTRRPGPAAARRSS